MSPLHWIAAGILALFVVTAGLFVRLDARFDDVAREYDTPDSRFITLPDGAIAHILDSGPKDATPIVLLHGFASSAWAWDGWTAQLAPDYRVIRIDLPGHGLTRAAPGAGIWRADQTQFVAETMDALGVRKCVLAGNSMGGAVAWSFAGAHPDRVLALILVDSSGPGPDGPPSRVRQIMSSWYAPALRAAFRWAGGSIIMRASLRAGVADPRGIHDADVRRTDLFWRLHRGELLTAFVGRAPQSQGAAPSLSAITAPTLVIQGGRDTLVPRAAADALTRGIKGARLVLFPARGHTPHQEDPVATAAEVRAFLKDALHGG